MDQIKTPYLNGSADSKQGGRAENQDRCGYVETPFGSLFVLCDGMGGGPGGSTASTTVVNTVMKFMKSQSKDMGCENALREAIALAEKAIIEMSQANPELNGMGSTIVSLLINEKSAFVAHVGDSRLYQLRSSQVFKNTSVVSDSTFLDAKRSPKIVFRTADHSMVGGMVQSGNLTEEQARLSPQSNMITRAINGRGIAQPDIVEISYKKGDLFVLCSDGVWGSMPEPELVKKLLNRNVNGLAEQIAIEVDNIGRNSGGGHDNLTIIVGEAQKDSRKKGQASKGTQLCALVFVLALLGIAIATYCCMTGSEESLDKDPTVSNPVDTCSSSAEMPDSTRQSSQGKSNAVNEEQQTPQSMPQTESQSSPTQSQQSVAATANNSTATENNSAAPDNNKPSTPTTQKTPQATPNNSTASNEASNGAKTSSSGSNLQGSIDGIDDWRKSLKADNSKFIKSNHIQERINTLKQNGCKDPAVIQELEKAKENAKPGGALKQIEYFNSAIKKLQRETAKSN